MADMVSTLTFSGTINGKAVSYTNTYTITDVEDAGDGTAASAPDPILSGDTAFPLPGPTFNYSAPQFAVVYNLSDCDKLLLAISGPSGSPTAEVYMPPGSIFILNKSTDGGAFNESATVTTSIFVDIDQLSITNAETNGPDGPYRVFAAYKNPAS